MLVLLGWGISERSDGAVKAVIDVCGELWAFLAFFAMSMQSKKQKINYSNQK